MKPNKTIVIGKMDNSKDHTFVSANIVHFRGGCCPTIQTCTGGNIQPKTIKNRNHITRKIKYGENKILGNG